MVKLKINSMLNFLENSVTGVFFQKKTSVIEGGVNRCSQTNCLYFILELNQLLLVDTPSIIHEGDKYSFEYNVNDMIKCLISYNKEALYHYSSTPNNLIFLIYPHKKGFKKIIKTHISS